MIIFCLFSLVTTLSDTPDSLVIEYSAEYVKNKVGDKVQYDLKEDAAFPEEIGLPALPWIKRKILTPVEGRIELKYKVLRTRIEKETPTIVQYYGESEIRKVPESYTPPAVKIIENSPSPNGSATIIINPFSFDGKKVQIRSDIRIKIYFIGGKWISPIGYQQRNPNLFLNQIRGEKIRIPSIHKLRQGAFLYAKIKTTKEGLYEITPADLQRVGINASSIDPEEIEILGGYDKIMNWRMDSLLAMDTLPGILPAVYEGNGNGTFEEGERILFYAHSLSGWGRNNFNNNNFFYYHPYTDTNVYWLRFSGENPHTMEEISRSGGENVTHFIDTIHLEEDVYTPLKCGLAWGWEQLNTGKDTLHPDSDDNLALSFTAPNIYNNQAIIRVGFYPKTAGTYDIRISLNGESISKSVVSQGIETRDRTVFTDTINSLHSGLNNLVITLETPEESIIMDYIEVIYERELAANGNELSITQEESLIRNYMVEGFTNNPYVINISDSRNPSLISHSFSNGNTNFSTDSRKILLQSFSYSIEGISLDDPTDLFQGGADWIAITPNQFVAQAARLKNWRENHLRGFSSPQARVVDINDIYNNFSYGVKDPSAIKRFLYWTQENWNPPVSYALLFGNGSYDEKNLTRTGKTSFIPIHTEGTAIYQPPSSPYLQSNSCVDNWFVDFNEDPSVDPDIPIGRVTVSNISEAKVWADKLIDYENSAGDWRMKVILLADDAIKTNPNRSPNTEKVHTTLMETLSNSLPDWTYRDKIYLMEYTMSSSGTKPTAQEAHNKSMSDGAIAGFYLGHGNLRQLADEKALEIQDINLFSNWRKTPFYYYGSCEVGYFERPDENCIAGYATIYKDGGNIVSIAAGRSTEYTDNGNLGIRIATHLFNNSVPTAGDVFLLAISAGGHKSYTLFGDPATSILIDSVSLDVEIPDTAIGGRQLEIKGSVSNSAEKIFCYFTEASYDTVLNATEDPENIIPVPIKKEGKTIFRGSAHIANDSFNVKVNIPYNIESDSGKISLYSRGEKEAYFTSYIYFIEGSLPEDTLPPSLEFKLQDRLLKRGDLIPPSGKITLIVRDSSGLDLRTKTNLQVIINNREPLFMTDGFSYVTGSSTTGEVTFSYESSTLSDSINFEVYAKDNAGNIAVDAVSFKIGEEELLWNIRNYPNPMKDKTVIVYHLSEEVPVEIRIFTIAGRLVKELSPGASRYGANYVEWDGRDKKGRKVSNGIYYYAIKAGNAEPHYGKIAVIR